MGALTGSREPSPEPERWRTLDEAPENITRCLGIEDDLTYCRWHFVGKQDDKWYDLSNGEPVALTHWMPLPLPPNGDHD